MDGRLNKLIEDVERLKQRTEGETTLAWAELQGTPFRTVGELALAWRSQKAEADRLRALLQQEGQKHGWTPAPAGTHIEEGEHNLWTTLDGRIVVGMGHYVERIFTPPGNVRLCTIKHD